MSQARGGNLRILGVKGVWVQLKDPRALRQAMDNEGVTIRGLAEACGLKSHSMITQLRSGARDSCSPELAASIAFTLNVRREHLFVTQTSRDTPRTVQRNRRKPQRVAGAA